MTLLKLPCLIHLELHESKTQSILEYSHCAVPKVYIVPQVNPYIMRDRNHYSKTQAVPLQSSPDYSGVWSHSTTSTSAERFFVGWCVTVLLCALHFSLLTGHFLLPYISKNWNLISACACRPRPQVDVWFSALTTISVTGLEAVWPQISDSPGPL